MDHKDDESPPQNPEESPEWIGTIQIKKASPKREITQQDNQARSNRIQNMTPYERRSVWLQWTIAVITGTYAFFSFLQWKAMNHTLQITKEGQVAAHRPWILPAKIETNGPFVSGQPFSVTVSLKNTGNGPGLAYNGYIYVLPVNASPYQGKDLPNCPGREHLGEGSLSVVGPQLYNLLKKTVTLTLDGIEQETQTILACGGANYEDIFHDPHYTRFCFMYLGRRKEFVICPKGEMAD